MEYEKTDLYELELNFSNICGANCIICSRPHGVGNIPFMCKKVFDIILQQAKDIKTLNMIQTSGNGEAFLNPNYLDYISQLKKEFTFPVWTYNNFSLLNRDRANRIVQEQLFDKIHVRVDSLDKQWFETNSNLNQDLVFENLKYFMSINTKIPVTILYNNIKSYYKRCWKILEKRPERDFFTDDQLDNYANEAGKIRTYFEPFSKVPIDICEIGHSLWGERRTATPDYDYMCPKVSVISHVTWICPNGDVSVCCYDDTQSKFIVGNILDDHILDIWNSDKRLKIVENIKNKAYNGTAPCTSPRCCGFGDKEEIKKK